MRIEQNLIHLQELMIARLDGATGDATDFVQSNDGLSGARLAVLESAPAPDNPAIRRPLD